MKIILLKSWEVEGVLKAIEEAQQQSEEVGDTTMYEAWSALDDRVWDQDNRWWRFGRLVLRLLEGRINWTCKR